MALFLSLPTFKDYDSKIATTDYFIISWILMPLVMLFSEDATAHALRFPDGVHKSYQDHLKCYICIVSGTCKFITSENSISYSYLKKRFWIDIPLYEVDDGCQKTKKDSKECDGSLSKPKNMIRNSDGAKIAFDVIHHI